MVFMKKKEIIICSSIIMSCLLLIYFYYENTTLQITNYSISSSKIPNEFNDYKIIQISDYHNEKSNRLNKFLIEKIVILQVKRRQQGNRDKRQFSSECCLKLKGRCVTCCRMQYFNICYGENIKTFTGSIVPIMFHTKIACQLGRA